MLAHGIHKALISTGHGQNLYFAFDDTSSFKMRAKVSLGYDLGAFKLLEKTLTEYRVFRDVLTRGKSKDDP